VHSQHDLYNRQLLSAPRFLEDTMSDNHHDTEPNQARTGLLKNPKQLLTVIFSLVVPIFVIISLVTYFVSDKNPAASGGNSEQAVEARIQKVGSIAIGSNASQGPKSGEDVFKAQCTTCHTAGVLGAPKFGDASAWAPRIATGYAALLNSAVKGKNAMSPQGGGQFAEFEIGRAVVYMANAAGAKFAEPKAAEAK
jgi:cytochrome c5